jgi:pimeloyl-ACP methyl ester carboxylesterase
LIAQGSIAPLVVVMPGGDYEPGKDYAAFMLSDLVLHVEQTTRVARDRLGRAIGGISLGGSLALTLALEHPDLFSAVGGHSPLLVRRLPSFESLGQDRVHYGLGQGFKESSCSGHMADGIFPLGFLRAQSLENHLGHPFRLGPFRIKLCHALLPLAQGWLVERRTLPRPCLERRFKLGISF